MVICFSFFFFMKIKKTYIMITKAHVVDEHSDQLVYKTYLDYAIRWFVLQSVIEIQKHLLLTLFLMLSFTSFLVLFAQVFLHHGPLNKYNKIAKIYTVEQFLMLELNFIIQSGKNLGFFFFYEK